MLKIPRTRRTTRAQKNKLRKAIKTKVRNALISSDCVDCGESDPATLEFDHVRGEKRFNISHAARAPVSMRMLNEELKKCDIRCSNCHRKKTAKEQNWWSSKLNLSQG